MSYDNTKVIYLKKGLGLVFTKGGSKRLATVVGLCHNEQMVIQEEWLGIVDFIAILEMVIAGRFGTDQKEEVGKLCCFGVKKKTYMLHIQILDYGIVMEELRLTPLECRQLDRKRGV